tara:strand:+ start:22721 stop:26350 length:3630 start_codon:yes stop_codon:yes gene_type:complete
MPKSKYPNKLDTSVEIPVVRDNITEIGSDVLNSLRSAIFQMQKTLGINPQGAVGNTVSNRLDNSLDENGNILKEALDRANVLSGPIIDADVSKVAAIREYKLRLDYPTQLLQDEISILNTQIDEIIEALKELSAMITAHINPSSIHQHMAIAIDVDSAPVLASDTSSNSLESGNVQDVFETIYNAHVNYTGLNISGSNNSHSSDQIYYNNEETSDIIFNNDVQGAIDDIANIGVDGIRNTILNLHSNGIIRSGSVVDGFEDRDYGDMIVVDSSIGYASSKESTTLITFNPSVKTDKMVGEFDILTISGSSDEDNGDYSIQEVRYSSSHSDELESVSIFGSIKNDSVSGSLGNITRNIYTSYNQNSLNCVVRTRKDHTNTPNIQVAHPNSATIITSMIYPEKITSDNNSFDISVDGEDPITIYTYNEDLIEQTLDSIILYINDQCVDNHLNFMAYKIRQPTCYEVAISHNLPNASSDNLNRTLTISVGADKDGTTELGLSGILDIEREGTTGNLYHINGYLYNELGNILQLGSADINVVAGSSKLLLSSSTAVELGIRLGDLVVVSGSSDSSDDGTYTISYIEDKSLFIDDETISFNGSIENSSNVFVIKSTSPVGEMTFTESVTVTGSILFDVILREDRVPYFSKRLEMDGELRSAGFIGSIIDVSQNFIISGEEAVLTVDSDGLATLEDPMGQISEPMYVGTDGMYKVYSADKLSFVVMAVSAASLPSSAISLEIRGFSEVSLDNLFLCRGLFGTSLGRVFGTEVVPGIPVLIDKRATGTTDKTIISENFIEKYIEGPRNELRSGGIIRGCQVTYHQEINTFDSDGNPVTYQEVDISSGVAYVGGIRYEVLGHEKFRVNLAEDFYIGIDSEGCIIAEPDPSSDGYTTSPFYTQIVAHIAFIDIDHGWVAYPGGILDLRLFIDHLDYKYLGDVTVANDQRFAHFTTVEAGINYAKRFTKIFPNMGTPSVFIKEGTYELSTRCVIDVDMTIRGVGPGTIIKRASDFTSEGSDHDAADMAETSQQDRAKDYMFRFGYGSMTDSIENGVTIEKLTLVGAEGKDGAASFINIRHNVDNPDHSQSASFIVSEVRFIGASDYNTEGDHTGAIPNAFPVTIGFGDAQDRTYQNVIVKNCYFDNVGYYRGVVYLQEGVEHHNSIFKNILVTGNHSVNRPYDGGGTTSPTDNGFIRCGGADDWITLESVLEVSNTWVE